MRLPDPRSFRLDAQTVLAGIVLPVLCMAFDRFTLNAIVSLAPLALAALYLLGAGSLLLSSMVDPATKVMGILAGMLTAAAAAACIIAFALSAVGFIAALFGLAVAGQDRAGNSLFLLSLLALSTLWTAWVYVRRAHLAVTTSLFTHGRLPALRLGILGAAVLVAVVLGADRIGRHWLG